MEATKRCRLCNLAIKEECNQVREEWWADVNSGVGNGEECVGA